MKQVRVNLFLYYFLQFTWGILQNILGFFLYIVLMIINPRRKTGYFNGARLVSWKLHNSASIGIFIFLSDKIVNPTRVAVHEYGHTIQSCILGPFYLFIIGIPSFIWANFPAFKRNRIRGKYSYSVFYPEKWANYLGKKYTGLPSIDDI